MKVWRIPKLIFPSAVVVWLRCTCGRDGLGKCLESIYDTGRAGEMFPHRNQWGRDDFQNFATGGIFPGERLDDIGKFG